MALAAAVRRLVLTVAFSLPIWVLGPAWGQNDELQEANQLLKQGQLDRALDRVNAYLGRNAKDARGRFLKGIIFAEQKKQGEAIKIFTELTQDYPELPEPYNNLAVLHASQGQYDKARVALEMAIRTHPSYATAHENLGDIYAKMASQAYDKALQLDKGNTTAQAKLNLIKDLFPAKQPRQPSGQTGASGKLALAGGPKTAAAPEAAQPPAKVAASAPVQAKEPAKQEAPRKPAENPAAAESTQPKPRVAKAEERATKAPTQAAPAQDPQEVIKALKQWAHDWSANDVDGYLSHYATDFRTPKGEDRSVWEAQRRARIRKPRKIEVDVISPKVTFTDTRRATVTFRQRYESGSLKLLSNKTIVVVRSGNRWLIQEERVGS